MSSQTCNTILLVEDADDQVLLVQQAVALCLGEVNLAVVRDTPEALQWLSDAIEDGIPVPRLILLDLKLPKISGLAVLRSLRMDTRLAGIPIVVYSELHEPSDVVLSYQLGANTFIKRPVDASEFGHVLHELADLGWLDARQSELPAPRLARY